MDDLDRAMDAPQRKAADPLDSAMDSYIGGKTAGFRASVSTAASTNPEEAARQVRIAKLLGRPLAAVEALPNESAQDAKLHVIEQSTTGAPATRSALTNTDFAKLAHDDTDNLSSMEKALRVLTAGGRSMARFFGDAPAAALAIPESAAKLFAPALDSLSGGEVRTVIPGLQSYRQLKAIWNNDPAAFDAANSEATFTPQIFPENPLRRIAAGSEASRKQQTALGDKIQGELPKDAGLLERNFYNATQSFGNQLPALSASIITRNPGPALAWAGLSQGAQSTTEALDKGASPSKAIALGTADATAEMFFEKFGVNKLLGDIKAGTPLMKMLGGQIVREVPGELATTAVQNANQWMIMNPEKSLGDYMNELGPAERDTAITTVMQTLMTAGLGGAASRVTRRQAAAERAGQHAETLSGIDQIAAASKVRERDVGTFEQFIHTASQDGPVQDLYIDARVLAQSGLADQVSLASPTAAQQMQTALATGGEVRIPVSEYTARIAGTDLSSKLLDDLRVSGEQFTKREAEAYMQSDSATALQDEMAKLLAEKEGDQAYKDSAEQVKQSIKAQLDEAARFTSPVHDAYASLASKYYAVQAAGLGITPQEMFQRLPLKIQAGTQMGAGVLNQSDKYRGDMTRVTIPATNSQAALSPEESAFYKEMGIETSVQTPELDVPVWKSPHVELANPRDVTEGHDVFYRAVGDERAVKYDIKNADGEVVGHTVLEIQDGQPTKLLDIEIQNEQKGKRYGENTISAIVHDAHGGELGISHIVDGARSWWDRLGTRPVDATHGSLSAVEHTAARSSRDDSKGLGETLAQGARASFNPSTSTISLNKAADLSSFLHELGHFFLETQFNIAAQADSPVELQQDAQTLLDWFGVKDLSTWHALDLEQQREHHEKFARGFESYLFEGKSPSVQMQSLFQKFRAWMVSVYKDIRALNVELTPEVRGVMDRMIATTDEIKQAEFAQAMMPMFATPEEADMGAEEFAAYHALGTQASNDAISELETRGLRDMQWLNNARNREIKKLQKQHKELRAAVKVEAAIDVMSRPEYQAWAYLTAKDENGNPTTRLSRESLEAMYGGATESGHDKYALLDWKRLTDLKMTAADGVHPDAVGEHVGFSSGDEMVRALIEAEKPSVEIESETEMRMLAQYGDLTSEEALTRAADEAIHNETRAKLLATEANALAKAVGKPKILAEAARAFADSLISRQKIRDLRPSQHTIAEAKAGKAAEKARRAGDIELAATEKRNQLIHNYAARATYNAQDETQRAIAYFARVQRSQTIPSEYMDQIHDLLSKYSLAKESLRAIDKRVSLRTWVQGRLRAGEIPNISERLLSEHEQATYRAQIEARNEEGDLIYPDDEERIKLLAEAIDKSETRSYKDMTVEELRGLNDTIKQVEHLGRLKNTLLTAKDNKTYAETRDLLAAAVVESAKKSGKNVRTSNTLIGKKIEALAAFGVSHIKAATWAQIFDGGKDGGPWWSTMIRTANERAGYEATKRAESTKALMALFAPVIKNVSTMDQIGKGRPFPGLGTSLNWEERMAFALNYGNESNLQRLMGGGIAGVSSSLSMGQVQSVLRTLTHAEWNTVQGVWDHFETMRPEIAAKEIRVNGVEPEWIAARPFTVQTADGQSVTLRGGYYPVVFDAKTSLKAQEHADATAAKDAMKAAYSAATTQRSFTKARVEEVSGRPLLLNLRGLYSGVNDVIHDLAWHEWAIDMNRLLGSSTIDEAIREHHGSNVKRELTKWRDDIIAGDKRLDHGIENAVGWARKFISSSALTYNVMSAVIQPLGITQSFSRVGVKWVGQGIGQFVGDPFGSAKSVQDQSEFMRNRGLTMFRDLNELRNRVSGQTTARELMGRYGYFFTRHMQSTVDIPTWLGAQAKAMSEGHDEKTAVALADQAVKDSQGGGEIVDQAGITRGGPLVKLFTAFYEFMNTQANTLYLKGATEKDKANVFAHFAMVGVMTPILGAALKDALTPGDSGDWDDWDKAVSKALSEGLSNLIGMMAFGREFTQVGKVLFGQDKGMGYSGPTGLRAVPDSIKLAQQAKQGELDSAFRKSLLNVMGDLSGVPSVQINRTINGIEAMSDGQTDNPAALVFGYQHQ